MELGVIELGVAVVGGVVVIAAALLVMRLVRRVVSGCVTAGLGCLVLAVGLVVIGALLASRTGVTGVRDLLDLLPGR